MRPVLVQPVPPLRQRQPQARGVRPPGGQVEQHLPTGTKCGRQLGAASTPAHPRTHRANQLGGFRAQAVTTMRAAATCPRPTGRCVHPDQRRRRDPLARSWPAPSAPTATGRKLWPTHADGWDRSTWPTMARRSDISKTISIGANLDRPCGCFLRSGRSDRTTVGGLSRAGHHLSARRPPTPTRLITYASPTEVSRARSRARCRGARRTSRRPA